MKYRIVWNAERQCWDVMWSGSTSRAARFESLLDAEKWVLGHDERPSEPATATAASPGQPVRHPNPADDCSSGSKATS